MDLFSKCTPTCKWVGDYIPDFCHASCGVKSKQFSEIINCYTAWDWLFRLFTFLAFGPNFSQYFCYKRVYHLNSKAQLVSQFCSAELNTLSSARLPQTIEYRQSKLSHHKVCAKFGLACIMHKLSITSHHIT